MDKPVQKKTYKSVLIKNLVFIVGLVIFSLMAMATKPEHKSPDVTIEDFAKCLKKTGFVMYGNDGCAYCKAQKEMFGSAFSGIQYVNCDFEEKLCADLKLGGFPTWIFQNKQSLGIQNFDQLARFSGCHPPQIL